MSVYNYETLFSIYHKQGFLHNALILLLCNIIRLICLEINNIA